MTVPVWIGSPSTVALRILADLRNSCSTAELCRRQSRIADAQRHQLFDAHRSRSPPGRWPSTTLEQLITVKAIDNSGWAMRQDLKQPFGGERLHRPLLSVPTSDVNKYPSE